MDSYLRSIQELLVSLEVEGKIHELPVAVPTADAAAAQLGCEIGAIANSLVFTADGAPLLVIASGAHRVDLKKVAALAGVKKVHRASADVVVSATGQKVDGVAPVGHPRALMTLVDETLQDYPVVWAGAGTENAMFPTTADELVRITDGTLAAMA